MTELTHISKMKTTISTEIMQAAVRSSSDKKIFNSAQKRDCPRATLGAHLPPVRRSFDSWAAHEQRELRICARSDVPQHS